MPIDTGVIVVLRDRGGRQVTYPINLTSFGTDLSLQLSSGQVKRGMAHRPIRVQERFLNIEVAWPIREWETGKQAFNEALRNHFMYALDVGSPEPMQLHYRAINRIYYGFIEAAERGDQRFTVVYTQTYRMRLVNADQTAASSLDVFKNPEPYVPGAQDVATFGDQWYSTIPGSTDVIDSYKQPVKGPF